MADLIRALRNADAAGDEEAARRIAAMIRAQQQEQPEQPETTDFIPTEEALAEQPEPQPEPTLGEKLVGVGETALTALTGATGGAVGYGLGTLEGAVGELTGRLEEGEGQKLAEEMGARLTYAPRTEVGQKFTRKLGEVASVLPPVLGTTPISTLRAAIPKRPVTESMLKSPATKKVLLKREIASGNPNVETLAKTLNSQGDIVSMPASKKAVSVLGGGENAQELVSVLERMNKFDKKAAREALKVVEGGKGKPLFRQEFRPSDVVGNSLASRAKDIATLNNRASKQIGNIANSLKGKPVNIQTPTNNFFNQLNDMGVTFTRGEDGWITPDFSRSKFKGGNQQDMTVLINELAKGDTNFKQAHKLKMEIRDNINFDKGGAGQLRGESESLLRELSRNIDDVLDTTSEPYKKANERYAKTINLKDQFDKFAGKDIDLFSDVSKQAFAQKARRLTSNTETRPQLMQLLKNTDDTLKDLGIRYKDNPYALNYMVNQLEDIFKLAPDTSLKGIGTSVAETATPLGMASRAVRAIDELTAPDFDKKLNALKAVVKE